MRALVVGCGYVGFPLAKELARRGHEVFGLRRSSDTDGELHAAGVQPLHADISRAETLVDLPNDFDWVVNCVASGGGGVDEYRALYRDGMHNLVRWLMSGSDGKKTRLVYTSSTGVYGQNDGSLVDETSVTEPATDTARVLVEAENCLLSAGREHGFAAMILRAAGIYGPGRGYLLKQFLRGEARIEGSGDRIMNMVHRDDLISAIFAALERGQGGEIYNAVDHEPVSQRQFFEWLAARMGRALPPVIAEESAAPRKRGLTSKRISNRKLCTALGLTFTYPDYRVGYSVELARLGF